MHTITEARIYEAQGLKQEALEIYKNILKKDKNNALAKEAIMRLAGAKLVRMGVDCQMLDFFLHASSASEINEFKRWLIDL